MTEEKMVLISLKEYQRLVSRDIELNHLEVCGVDNWSGYGQYNDITGGDGWSEIEHAKHECEEAIYIPFEGCINTFPGTIEGLDISNEVCLDESHYINNKKEENYTNAIADDGISSTKRGVRKL